MSNIETRRNYNMYENNDCFIYFRNLYRNIEKTRRKCANIKASIKFNKTCLLNGLYPSYVKIKMRGRAVTNNDDIKAVQDKEIQKEIACKSSELITMENKLT